MKIKGVRCSDFLISPKIRISQQRVFYYFSFNDEYLAIVEPFWKMYYS